MSVSIKDVVIKDACILFDLIDMGLMDSFYKLDLTVVTTPEVIDEITDETQRTEVNRYISTGALQIDEFGVFETIASIIAANPGLSFTDGSVIELATRRNAAILSSDKSLRNESERRQLTVRGMLWILLELHRQEIITREVLLKKLDLYPAINKRAPKTEIEKLIKKLTEQEREP